jgi:hypothetical protein
MMTFITFFYSFLRFSAQFGFVIKEEPNHFKLNVYDSQILQLALFSHVQKYYKQCDALLCEAGVAGCTQIINTMLHCMA